MSSSFTENGSAGWLRTSTAFFVCVLGCSPYSDENAEIVFTRAETENCENPMHSSFVVRNLYHKYSVSVSKERVPVPVVSACHVDCTKRKGAIDCGAPRTNDVCTQITVVLPMSLPVGETEIFVESQERKSEISQKYFHKLEGYFECETGRADLVSTGTIADSVFALSANSDGKKNDVAVSSSGVFSERAMSLVHTFQGEESSSVITEFENLLSLQIITFVDLNEDSCDDMVGTFEDGAGTYTGVALGVCDGTFSDPVQLTRNRVIGAYAEGSVRGQAPWINTIGTDEVVAYRATDTGGYEETRSYDLESVLTLAKGVDINKDGVGEIVTWNPVCTGLRILALESGAFRVVYSDNIQCADYSGFMVTSGDLDRNGYVDIVQARIGSIAGTATKRNSVWVYWSMPEHVFELAEIDTSIADRSGIAVSGLGIGDLGGDNRDEIYAGGIYTQRQGRIFESSIFEMGVIARFSQSGYGDAVIFLDIDGDGDTDLVGPKYAIKWLECYEVRGCR